VEENLSGRSSGLHISRLLAEPKVNLDDQFGSTSSKPHI
jgi:hypothetical protein